MRVEFNLISDKDRRGRKINLKQFIIDRLSPGQMRSEKMTEYRLALTIWQLIYLGNLGGPEATDYLQEAGVLHPYEKLERI